MIKVACMPTSTLEFRSLASAKQKDFLSRGVERETLSDLESHRLARASAYALAQEVGTSFVLPVVQPTHLLNASAAVGASTRDSGAWIFDSGTEFHLTSPKVAGDVPTRADLNPASLDTADGIVKTKKVADVEVRPFGSIEAKMLRESPKALAAGDFMLERVPHAVTKPEKTFCCKRINRLCSRCTVQCR